MLKDVLKVIKNDMWTVLSNKKYLQAQIKNALREIEADRKGALAENAATATSHETLVFWNRTTNEIYDRKRISAINHLFEQWHNDQSYYLIYKDGSEATITAEEILGGEPFPKVSNVVYAEMSSADDHLDTESGDLNWYSDEAMEACDYDYDAEGERKWQYEAAIQYKFGTAWSARFAQSHPEFIPAAL